MGHRVKDVTSKKRVIIFYSYFKIFYDYFTRCIQWGNCPQIQIYVRCIPK